MWKMNLREMDVVGEVRRRCAGIYKSKTTL
jgi:hypothetical protein